MLFADRLEVWNPGELPPSFTPASLRHPHASIPRNPLLAEPLFLTRHIEKAGTGIMDMIGLCKAAKLRPPEFRQELGQFIQTLWRPESPRSPMPTEQVGEQVTEQVARLLQTLGEEARGGREIMDSLGLRHRPTFLYDYLQPALAAGWIEMTNPGSPKSPVQKYRLTRKGTTWRAKQIANGSRTAHTAQRPTSKRKIKGE